MYINITGQCSYKRLEKVTKVKGNNMGGFQNSKKDIAECTKQCDYTEGCESIGFCPPKQGDDPSKWLYGCYLKDTIVNASHEQTNEHGICFTAYKDCNEGTLK